MTSTRRSRLVTVALLLTCAAAYGVSAALAIGGGPLADVDHSIFAWTRAHYSLVGWQLASGLANLGAPSVAPVALLVIGAALAWRGRGWRPLRVAVIAVVLLAVGVLASKAGFGRLGPPAAAPAAGAHSWTLGDLFVRGGKRGAFPSGHTTTAVVTWTVGLWLLCGGRLPRRAQAAVASVAAVVGGSLIYAGFHWLSDVLAGWGFGALIAWLALWLARGTPWRRDVRAPTLAPTVGAVAEAGSRRG